MPKVLNHLLGLLALERIEENLFRGQSQDLGWGTVFGGQVLGQALSAAAQTVPPERQVHSMHAYFLRPGDVSAPIVYTVDPIRDGRSFTTRRVVAIQHGKAIFNLSSSFQTPEPGLDHQPTMPDAPPPESLQPERELAKLIAHKLPESMRSRATGVRPIELRHVNPNNPLKPAVMAPRRQVWMKAIADLPDDPAVHRYMLAYASDFGFVTTALNPHGVSWMSRRLQVASIDHAMWFHRDFRMDDWLLYDIDSPSASGARGLVRGQIFNRDGVLVASTAQEGLMRHREPKAS